LISEGAIQLKPLRRQLDQERSGSRVEKWRRCGGSIESISSNATGVHWLVTPALINPTF
jgi:hypothetical protein